MDTALIETLYVNQRMTIDQVAAQSNIPRSNVYRHLKKHSLIRPTGTRGKQYPISQIISMYEHERLGHTEISERLGIRKSIISKILQENGFPRKNGPFDGNIPACMDETKLNYLLERINNIIKYGNKDIKSIVLHLYNYHYVQMYNTWSESGYKQHLSPSIDHIIPISKGGSIETDNLQMLTWLENRLKRDLMPDEWATIKKMIHHYFIDESSNVPPLQKKNYSIDLYRAFVLKSFYNISIDEIIDYDLDKLKFLYKKLRYKNSSRIEIQNDKDFRLYIHKFMNDTKFHKVYDNWIYHKQTSLMKPSIDHIVPVSDGGARTIDNLQFITLMENYAKYNLPLSEWLDMRPHIQSFL